MSETIKSLNSKATFISVLKLFFIPITILLSALVIVSVISYENNKSQIYRNCITSLSSYSQFCENEIKNSVNSSTAFSSSQEIMSIMLGEKEIHKSVMEYEIKSSMSYYLNNNQIVDSVFIMDSKSKDILTTDGLYNSEDFFKNKYSYDNYDSNYWYNFIFFDQSPYRILSPSAVHSDDVVKSVIPIVFHSINSIKTKNYLIINISLDKLLESARAKNITDNAEVLILNRYTGQVFGKNEYFNFRTILSTPLHDKLLAPVKSFNYKLNHEKYFISSFSTSGSLVGYTYFALVPYSDIYNMMSYMFVILGAVLFIFVLAAVFFCIRNTRIIIRPFEAIERQLESFSGNSPDIFSNINTAIKTLQKTNNDFCKTLQFTQGKYLVNYLNSTDLYVDKDAQEIIMKSLPFKNDYFVSVVFQLFPKQKFFETYSIAEYDTIILGLYNIVKQLFTEQFNAFFLSSEKETYYIIVNESENFDVSRINALLNEIYNFLQYDNDFFNLYTGIGNLHFGIEGLKQSHLEAINMLKPVSFEIPKIISPNLCTEKTSYLLSDTDESRLYTMLMSMELQAAQNFIQDRVSQVMDAVLVKNIYFQILNTIIRVMYSKNIFNIEDFEDYANVISQSNVKIYSYILSLLSELESHKENINLSKNGNNIIEYIQKNVSDVSLSLESLSSVFNVNPNYISQIIKNNLGIGFHDYLSTLRITKAKELLSGSSKTIQEIYELSGFSSKQTFFRVFKKLEGITPNEYRKQNKISK